MMIFKGFKALSPHWSLLRTFSYDLNSLLTLLPPDDLRHGVSAGFAHDLPVDLAHGHRLVVELLHFRVDGSPRPVWPWPQSSPGGSPRYMCTRPHPRASNCTQAAVLLEGPARREEIKLFIALIRILVLQTVAFLRIQLEAK